MNHQAPESIINHENVWFPYRTYSSHAGVDGSLPVSGLHGLLREEEVHLVIVTVIIIRDEVGRNKLRIWREGRRESG